MMKTKSQDYFNITTFTARLSIIIIYIASVLLLFTNVRILSYAICVLALSLILSIRSKSIGVLTRLVLSFLLITCIQQIIGLLFWKTGQRFTYFWALAPILSIIVVKLLLKRNILRSSISITKNDLIAVLFSSFFILTVSLTTISNGPILQKLIQYSTTGFDYSTHQSLVLSLYETQGYIYGSQNMVSSKIVYKDLSSYPQGWHLSNSIAWRGVTNNLTIINLSSVMELFFITMLAWYGIVTYLITVLVFELMAMLIDRKPKLNDYIIPLGSLLLVQLTAILHIVEKGFVNYLGLIAYLIAMLIIALCKYDKTIKNIHFAIMGSLLAVGITFSWLLAAPIGFMLLIMVLAKSALSSHLYKRLYGVNFLYIILFIIICLSSVIQLYITVNFSQTSNHINATGGVWKTSYGLLAILSIVFFSLIFFQKVKKQVSEPLLVFFSSVAILCSSIYIIQVYTSGNTGYYSDKVNILLVIFLIPTIGALMFSYAKKLIDLHGMVVGLFIVIGVFVIFPIIFTFNPTSLRFLLAKNRKLSAYTSSQIVNLQREHQKFDNNIIIFKDLDYEEDVITTHMLNTISRKDTECSKNIFSSILLKDKARLINGIILCSEENQPNTYYVISSSKNNDELVSVFKNSPNIQVLLSN